MSLYEHTIEEAPEIVAHYSIDEDGVQIEFLKIHGQPAGEFLESNLRENHGDRWEKEIEKSLDEANEQARVDSILYERAS